MLNNKQLVDVKKITVFQDVPMRAPSLNDALALGKEKLEYEDEENEAEGAEAAEIWAEEEKAGDGAKRSEKARRSAKSGKRTESAARKESALDAAGEGGEDEDPLQGLDERLKGLNLDE